MKIRIFKLQKQKVSDERYIELTDDGCHPSDDEVNSLYKEVSPIVIDVKVGDMFEADGLPYCYVPSGIEIRE